MVEVPRHEIRRSDQVRPAAALAPEPEDPGVLEVAADDRAHADVLRDLRNAGAKTADASDEQVDRGSGARGEVQRVDHLGVHERVHLQNDLAVLGLGLRPDHLQEPGAEHGRSDEQPAIVVLPAVARQGVEQIRHVGRDLGLGRQQADVLVDRGGLRVVVPRADVTVAANAIVLLPDHERDLRVRLQSDDAVDDVRARALEEPRPADVPLLVAARRELDERDGLLARFGGPSERAHDRAVLRRRAVDRLLDREDVWVPRSLVDERRDGGLERVVGVLDEHVSLAERLEDVVLSLFVSSEATLRDAFPRRRLQVGTIELRQLPQVLEPEHRLRDVDVGGDQAELLHQQGADRLRHRAVDLQPHGLRRALAPLHDRLDRGQEVVRLRDLDVDVGVARHAEGVDGDDLHAGEQHLRVRRDQLLEREEPLAVGERDEARDDRRHLDPREPAELRRRIADHDGEVERQVRDVRERMRGVDRQRGQDREHLPLERVAKMGACHLVEVRPLLDAHSGLGEQRADPLGEHAVLPCGERPHALADRIELLARRHPARARDPDARADLLLEAGDADLEELVEVAVEDREELHALHQRVFRVLRKGEHARVELEPGELAVDVALLGGKGDLLPPGAAADLYLGHAHSSAARGGS